MGEQEHDHESFDDKNHVDKLAFTAVAAPNEKNERDPHDLRDQALFTADGPIATKKEVYSYYTYYAGNNGIGSFQ